QDSDDAGRDFLHVEPQVLNCCFRVCTPGNLCVSGTTAIGSENDLGGQHHLPRHSTVTSQNARDGIAVELRGIQDVTSGGKTWDQLPIGVIEEIVDLRAKLQVHLSTETKAPGQCEVLRV